jgi:hypothetical protein
MRLPKLETPVYTTELPSSGKKIKYRPFLVKEEKIMMIASQEKDTKLIVDNFNKVLKNCVLTKDIDVEKLASYDAQWLFLKLREVSIGSTILANVKCPVTGKNFETEISLSAAKVIKSKDRKNKIMLDAGVGVVLKDLTLAEFYETLGNVSENEQDNSEFESTLDLVAKCIVEIFDNENVYPTADATKEEVQEFLENLSKDHFDKINEFFVSIPKIKLEEEVFSPPAQKNIKLVLDNFMDFFA